MDISLLITPLLTATAVVSLQKVVRLFSKKETEWKPVATFPTAVERPKAIPTVQSALHESHVVCPSCKFTVARFNGAGVCANCVEEGK